MLPKKIKNCRQEQVIVCTETDKKVKKIVSIEEE